MKPTEIMIGDYVLSHGAIWNVLSIQLHNIVVTDPAGQIRAELTPRDISPIPITPAMMELNAEYITEQFGAKTCVLYEDDNESVCFGYEKFKSGNTLRRLRINTATVNLSAEIRFVHELQHILRVFGYEDLSYNWEVE